MTEGYGGSPEALADRRTHLEGVVVQARHEAGRIAQREQDWQDEARLHMRCPYCGADPGDWCRTVTNGRRATWLHRARGYVLIQAAWHARETARAYAALAEANRRLQEARQ